MMPNNSSRNQNDQVNSFTERLSRSQENKNKGNYKGRAFKKHWLGLNSSH